MAAPLDQQPLAAPPSRKGLFLGMLQVALSSFGGGMSAWSQRIVVEQRRWMSNESFITGLTVARLFPGPNQINICLLYTSPSPRDATLSRMPSSA